jgi:citronellol/citronellal dehydrogenase
MSLKGKTLFITGASRGIGLAIALRAARDGANIAVAAKTTAPHKHLPGTIYSAAADIEKAGGKALPLVVDVRDEASVAAAVAETVAKFGGIDICVNNASAISRTPVEQTEAKRFDLMFEVNTRGTFIVSKACIPHLKRAANPHVLTMSPPLTMEPKVVANNVAYTITKYGMSMCTLGMSEEYRADGIAFNSLWPRMGVATAAIEFATANAEELRKCRKPEVMSDAAYVIFNRPSRSCTGNFFIDDTLLYDSGVRDFDQYRIDPTVSPRWGFFIPESDKPPPGVEK